MSSINIQAKQLPEFVCKTPSIRQLPDIKHDPYQSLIVLYLLRLVISLKAKLPACAIDDLFENQLGEFTGLCLDNSKQQIKVISSKFIDDESTSAMSESRRLNSLYKRIEKRLKQLLTEGMPLDAPLFNNIRWLAAELSMSACDQELLVISLLITGNRKFNTYLSNYDSSLHDTYLLDYLHVMTTRPLHELEKRLQPKSLLGRIGWLNVEESLDITRLVIPPSLLFLLFNKVKSPEALLRLFFKPVKPTSLQANAYPSLQNDFEVLLPYLHSALERQQPGVNVLIYGASEASKWELARVLAKCIDTRMYQITDTTSDGRRLEPQDRFAACQFTQTWLVQHHLSGLIVMNEAHEVLPQKQSTSFLDDDVDNKGIDLALMKRQMSENPVPMIWIINKPKNIDAACLRLFSYVLEVAKMPEALRHNRVDKAMQKLTVTSNWRQQLAKHSDIPLSQIEKAAAIAQLSQSEIGPNAENIMTQVLNSHSRMFNRTDVIQHHTNDTGYDPRFCNTTTPLDKLIKGLQRIPQGKFCFYGAPGTGKTAFAKHLAEQLSLPLLIKRASDILDMYVGVSEKNMAAMFREAQQEDAILLFDEADSLLSDRRDARHNWEVTKVNEMLTQMEQFKGIFICTTNLMEKMDAASLRRFDFKVKFDYLNPEQRWALFIQESQRLGVSLPIDPQEQEELKQQIQRLTKLTPGDFAVLNRQTRFSNDSLDLATIYSILHQECLAKGENFNKIGFVH
jgi:transitional endoplasmic reticulum ATPase